MQTMLARYPLGFGQWLRALAYALSKPREITIVGQPEAADTRALLSMVRRGYHPFQVVALGSPDGLQLALTRRLPSNAADAVGRIAAVPLLQDRGLVEGQGEHARPAAYVCRAFACHAAVTEPEELWTQLEQH